VQNIILLSAVLRKGAGLEHALTIDEWLSLWSRGLSNTAAKTFY